MVGPLTLATLAILVASILVVGVLALRRLHLSREDARRRRAEERVRPLALALVDGEVPQVPRLSDGDALALAGVLARYAHLVDGSARRHIADFFEAGGHVGRTAQALRDRRQWRRATAAYSMGDMGPAAIVPLIIALADSHRDVRSAAARSLGRLVAVDAVSPLVGAIVTGSLPMAVAGTALLGIGPAAVPELARLTNHPEPAARAVATTLLGYMGATSHAAVVEERLADADAAVRAAAARTLAELGDRSATTLLRYTLDDPEAEVRTAVAVALGALGDRGSAWRLSAQARGDLHEPALAAAEALATMAPDMLGDAAGDADAGAYLAQAWSAAEAAEAGGPR